MMKNCMRFLIILALIVTAGCAEFIDRPLAPHDTAAAFESRSLNDQNLRQFLESNLKRKVRPWPPAIWDFDTLSLAAFFYHPDLELARTQHEMAEAAEITAAQRPNPSVFFSPTYITHITGAPFNPWILGVSPDIPIETAGKRDDRIAHARQLSESARLKIATAAWLVRSRLRSTLLNLYAAQRTEALRAEQVERQQEMLALLEERLAVGEISRPEVAVGQLALEQARIAWHDAQQQVLQTRMLLADALGLPVTALSDIEISFEALERLPPLDKLSAGEMRQQALFNRSDLLSSLAEYEASQAAVQLEVAKQYPDLHLGPGVIYNQGEYKWVLGINLTLPVLNQNQGPIAEAEAHRKDSAARFKALQARIIGEIDRTSALAQADLQKLAAVDRWLDTQVRQTQSAEALFQAGESDRLTVAPPIWTMPRPPWLASMR
ncbi:MAG: TolC family protein [Methylococcales bacterium]